MTAAQYIDQLASLGRYHFTTTEAGEALGISQVATRAALRRLMRKGEIAVPFRGFYVIVPPEYRRIGCLPGEQLIDQLMRHLDEPYYVGLLSAAEYHGGRRRRFGDSQGLSSLRSWLHGACSGAGVPTRPAR